MPDIVLKDRNGNDITFPGINSIKVRTTNGGTQEFLNGEMVEKTVDPDFSKGNIEITAAENTFISKVTIEKPEDLLPENIRNGKEIGGVAGSAFVVDMVDTVVMEETDYDGFVEAMTGVYVRDFDFSLVSGETYNVIWGTQKFVLQANTLAEYVYIGNASIVGMGEDTGEPFAVASGDGFTSVITNESGDSYHFGISQKTREDVETAEVKLALADGDQEVIPSASDKVLTKVTIKKPEALVPENIAKDVDIAGVTGSLEVPETVETSIELDFSAGAMEVTPKSGQSFSAVNIPVPGTLIPENIAEGVDIAGIIGTLAAGGGGGNGNIVSKVVYVTPGSTSSFTVAHNLGVVPDIVLVYHSGTTTYKYANFWIGISTAAIKANILLPRNAAQYYYTNGWVDEGVGIDTTDKTMPLNNATASSIRITAPHSSYGKINTSVKHVVHVIGGLT